MKFSALIIMISMITLSSCSKDNDGPPEPAISYKYNGQQYTSKDGWSAFTLFDIFSFRFIYAGGIIIENPALFGGNIIIRYNRTTNVVDCAWLNPVNHEALNGNCSNLLTHSGQPIDSTKAYWMESASFTESVTQCNPTQTGPFKRCTLNVSFSLTLVNKLNQKIIITNGTCTTQIELPQ